MNELLTDFKDLKKHVKESSKPFKQAIIDYYTGVGEEQGHMPVKDAVVTAYNTVYEPFDLAWVKPEITFTLEYGKLRDIYPSLASNLVAKPKLAVYILNSKSQCKPDRVYELIHNTPFLRDLMGNTLILDLDAETVLKP